MSGDLLQLQSCPAREAWHDAGVTGGYHRHTAGTLQLGNVLLWEGFTTCWPQPGF